MQHSIVQMFQPKTFRLKYQLSVVVELQTMIAMVLLMPQITVRILQIAQIQVRV